jgi:hypothetical protein
MVTNNVILVIDIYPRLTWGCQKFQNNENLVTKAIHTSPLGTEETANELC